MITFYLKGDKEDCKISFGYENGVKVESILGKDSDITLYTNILEKIPSEKWVEFISSLFNDLIYELYEYETRHEDNTHFILLGDVNFKHFTTNDFYMGYIDNARLEVI